MPSIMSNKCLSIGIRVIVLIVSLLVLLRIVDLRIVINQLTKIPLYIILILLMLGTARLWVTSIRWRLLNPDVSNQLSKWTYFRYVMISQVYNQIMPGALGGDFVRAAMTVSSVNEKKADNLIAIVVDRFVGLLSILFLGTTAFIITDAIADKASFYLFFLAVYSGLFVLIIVFTNSYLHSLLLGIFKGSNKISVLLSKAINIWQSALAFFSANKKKVLFAFLLCLPIHIVSFFTSYLLARSLYIYLPFVDISLIVSMTWLITAIPITISGAGVRELSMVYLFSLYGVGAEAATTLSIYTYIIGLLLGMIGLLFLVDWGKAYYKLQSRAGGHKA